MDPWSSTSVLILPLKSDVKKVSGIHVKVWRDVLKLKQPEKNGRLDDDDANNICITNNKLTEFRRHSDLWSRQTDYHSFCEKGWMIVFLKTLEILHEKQYGKITVAAN